MAFLRPTQSRPNLAIISNAQASKINFVGTRAVSVNIEYKGKTKQVNAKKEIVLSACAIGSPQLLELFGIDSATRLQTLEIPPVIEIAVVGENLRDHLEVFFQHQCLS